MSLIKLLPPSETNAALEDDNTIIIDVRSPEAYWAGHLPGARHLNPALLALARTDAASIATFNALLAALLSTFGLACATRVVIHGQKLDTEAAKAVWALAYAGHDRIEILDGGLDALNGAIALVKDAPAVRATPYRPEFRPALLATADGILAGLKENAIQLVDARDPADYRGDTSSAARFGRIPGARHWPVQDELAHDGRLASPDLLRQRLRETGIGTDRPTVLYCGGGGRSARSFLAFSAAGHQNVAVYLASWREWGNRDDLPLETGIPVPL
ncbi:MAG: hypothetical protein LBB76_09570 [Azoarcus sp.]|nr:hypothetical protein [Azoarcus sp.]